MARIYPLFSGSGGNSYFLGSENSGVLIDAGKNAKQIGLKLELCGLSPNSVKAILITHEHGDHIAALRVFASKYNIPTYASRGTVNELITSKVANGKFPVYILPQELEVAGMVINHFNTPHDCAESIGFRIKTEDDKIFSFATDIGVVTSEIKENLKDSDFCVIESNHDVSMLQAGFYPYSLKQRVLSKYGHLSNFACADLIKWLHENGTRKYMLAHLSSENNTVSIAKETTNCVLKMSGLKEDIDYNLYVAPKENLDGRMVVF